jgi:Ca2+-transporting ATPase
VEPVTGKDKTRDETMDGPAPSGETAWYTLSVEEVAGRLQTDADKGLSESEAARRRQEHGPNVLAESRGRPALAIFVHQFKSLIVGLLLAAAAISFTLGENVEGIAILAVIVLNAVIGFLTEWKAEQALSALQKQSEATAHVVRAGEEEQIPSAELVPGDVIVLSAGSRVPADGRIVEAVRLQVEEASLTGESHAVSKTVEPVPDRDAPLGDRLSLAFMGTTVSEGRGRMIVTGTGAATEFGRIGTLVEEAGTRATPLEQKLAQLGHVLVGVILVVCAIIILVGWLRGNDFWHMLEVGISLAIAAVPEGLPAVTTMTLAIGMQRMARMRALVRRLPAVETLGSTTVICSDKTGTLTKNEMTVRAYHLDDRRIEVTGTGYAIEGEFRVDGKRVDPTADAPLAMALRTGALCADASFDHTEGAGTILGDPTEGALLVAAGKAGQRPEDLERDFPRIGEVPFTSENKRMVTVHRTSDGRTVAYVKGAPSVILDASQQEFTGAGARPLSPEGRQRLLVVNEELAGQALRVLALAFKDIEGEWREEDLAEGLVFVGLVGMIDPLREEAKDAIATCRQAGIRTIMITGDQEATATEIGRQLGLDRDPQGRPLRTVHGRDLVRLDIAGLQQVAAEAGVFARVSPEHKLRIVEALQARGAIVAMTGDGVNDAPALKMADIGVAMGIKGTEVAKEAADMVITDDNFATIVGAIEQGRIIYANIVRFIHYLFSCNLAEILVVFVAILLGWPLPLAALQVLWLNMITDVFPAMALALEPSSPGAMQRPPRDPKEPLVTWGFIRLIGWQGALLAGLTLLAFQVALGWYEAGEGGHRHAITVAFMTLALSQVFHVFNARSQLRSAIDARLFTNGWLWGAVVLCVALQLAAVYWPFLQTVLQTAPLGGADWALVGACSLAPIAIVEVEKLVRRLILRPGQR